MNVSFIILFLSVFCLSQLSLGNYIHLLGLVLLTLYLLVRRQLSIIDRKLIIFLISFFILSTASLLYFLYQDDPNISQISKDASVNIYLFINLVSILICFFIIIINNEYSKSQFKRAIKLLLIVHVSFFFLQYAVLIFSDYYIDFVQLITSERSRYINYYAAIPFLEFRPTGMYVEPSTYSAAILALIISYAFLEDVKINKSNLILISMLSMLLSLSSAALFEVIILYFAFYFNFRKRNNLYILFITLIIFILVLVFADGLVETIVNKIDATKHIREGLLHQIYFERELTYILFGYGFYGIEQNLYDLVESDFNYRIAAFNDAGLFNYIALKFGLFGLLVPISIMLYLRNKRARFFCFSALLISKLSYIHPILYLAMIPLMLTRDK